MSRYRLSPEAQQDLREIQAYLIEQGGTKLARYIKSELASALRFLAETPGAGHSREDLTDAPVKFWSVFSYMIVYDPVMQPIGVARILHASQDLETMFRDRPPQI